MESIASSTTRLTDAPMIANVLTTASPIINAEAVPAVRARLRPALSTASRPFSLLKRRIGQPSSPTIGPARTGAMTATPSSVSSAPNPTRLAAEPVSSGAHPEQRSPDSEQRDHAAERRAPVQRAGRDRDGVAHRGDRRDP